MEEHKRGVGLGWMVVVGGVWIGAEALEATLRRRSGKVWSGSGPGKQHCRWKLPHLVNATSRAPPPACTPKLPSSSLNRPGLPQVTVRYKRACSAALVRHVNFSQGFVERQHIRNGQLARLANNANAGILEFVTKMATRDWLATVEQPSISASHSSRLICMRLLCRKCIQVLCSCIKHKFTTPQTPCFLPMCNAVCHEYAPPQTSSNRIEMISSSIVKTK